MASISNSRKFARKYLPEFVYGGMDGSITTFAIVTGAMGASLSSVVVLVLGFANLFGDGFSMAVSNYFSTKSKNEIVKKPEKHEIKTAFATFWAFLIVGIIPLLSFVLAIIFKNSSIVNYQFQFSMVLTGIAFISIGWLKGIVTGKHKLKSSIETLLIGGMAALLAFAVGHFVKSLIN